MFTSARSYLSRFSSLILFILAVLIVGFLLVMTISSAANDTSNAGDNSADTSSTESNLTYDQPETEAEVEGASSSQTVSVESNTPSSTSYSTGNPQTLAVTEVNLDSQDSVNINTTSADSTGRVDASGTSINTAVLPDTGPNSIASVAIVLIVTILGLTYWNRSRQDLSRQLLTTNR